LHIGPAGRHDAAVWQPVVSAVVRPRLTVDGIVEAALLLLDDEGIEQLTTINLARRLGVTQPALYGHVRGLEELRALVAARGAQELSDRVRAGVAGRTGDEALQAMAHTYRDYVREHPDRYLIQVSAIRAPAYSSALELAAEAVRDVLRCFGLSEEQVLEAHVAFRAAVHGFVHLEARDALAARASADEHFAFFLRIFAAGLHDLAAR
jgi:AcrR family transcriptional regulator